MVTADELRDALNNIVVAAHMSNTRHDALLKDAIDEDAAKLYAMLEDYARLRPLAEADMHLQEAKMQLAGSAMMAKVGFAELGKLQVDMATLLVAIATKLQAGEDSEGA